MLDKGLTMYNRRSDKQPMLADAFDDWIDDTTAEDDKILAMLHFMAGAGAVVGLIKAAYGTGRTDAAGRIFADLNVEVEAFAYAARATAETLDDEETRQ
jgi:hypothetical protein